MRSNNTLEKCVPWIVSGITAFMGSILFKMALHKPFDHDEFQSIHIGWYLQNGFRPYSDFFEHHHLFYSYVLSILLAISGETTDILIATRLLSWAMAIGVIYLIFHLTHRMTGSRIAAGFAAFFPFTSACFLEKSIEIRPDILQILFLLLAIHYFFQFVNNGQIQNIPKTGLTLSLAFLTLQKTFYFVIVISILIGIEGWTYHRGKFIGIFWRYAISATALPILFFGYQIALGSLKDYLYFCWALNTHWFHWLPPIQTLFEFLREGRFWMTLTFMGIGACLFSPRWDRRRAYLLCLLGTAVLLIFTVRVPYRHHFLIPVAICSIFLGSTLTLFPKKLSSPSLLLVYLAGISCMIPSTWLWKKLKETNDGQLDVVRFVLERTNPTDLVYDGDCQFNLFRSDPSYFWFATSDRGVLQTFARIYRNENFQTPCEIIQTKRPKLISTFRLNIEKCGLNQFYRPIEFGLYERDNFIPS